VTKLFAIAGHFVSYRWLSGPHNFLVILRNLLKTKKRSGSKKVQDCWSRLNTSRAARNSFFSAVYTQYSAVYTVSIRQCIYTLPNTVYTFFIF